VNFISTFMRTGSKFKESQVLIWMLSVIRIVIGWHFLYEGVTKIIAGNWTSAAYLAGSKWIFAPLFHTMAESAGIIAFKVLAAGAIKPEDGLKYAFTNGDDFVCMGMYDFQIVEDANIALDVLSQPLERQRPWMG